MPQKKGGALPKSGILPFRATGGEPLSYTYETRDPIKSAVLRIISVEDAIVQVEQDLNDTMESL